MQIRKRSCREEYITTQGIESIADVTAKKAEKKGVGRDLAQPED